MDDKYLGKLDKIFFIYCTDGNRESIVNYMINRLFGKYAEIRYTSLCELPYLDYDYLFIDNNDDDFFSFDSHTRYSTFNCLIEHYKCLRQAYNRGFERIMICEDDFRIKSKDEEEFKATIMNIPDDGNIIKLHTWTNCLPNDAVIDDTNDELISYNEYFYKIVNSYKYHYLSTNCIIYDRKGMEFMMHLIETEFHPADRYFSAYFCDSFRNAINNNEINFYQIKNNSLIIAFYNSIIAYGKIEDENINNDNEELENNNEEGES